LAGQDKAGFHRCGDGVAVEHGERSENFVNEVGLGEINVMIHKVSFNCNTNAEICFAKVEYFPDGGEYCFEVGHLY
jgi:hypothetical protein